MPAPGGRGSAFILADAKVSKIIETKEYCDIKFVNSRNIHQYRYSNVTVQYLLNDALSTILIPVILLLPS